jgi:hypothetical protein
MGNPYALLRGKRDVLPDVPLLGFAEIAALFDDSFHSKRLASGRLEGNQEGGANAENFEVRMARCEVRMSNVE